MIRTIDRIATLLILCLLIVPGYSVSEIIGIPPHQILKIPFSKDAQYFDMTRDKEGVIYITYGKGIKIFNGSQWIELEINGGQFVRRISYAENDRVYFGGRNFFGYIEKDNFGEYTYKIISAEYSDFKDIWNIIPCDGNIYFGGLNDVFQYNPETEKSRSWKFESRIGGLSCINQKITLHHRADNTIRNLNQDQWVDTELSVLSSGVIYEMLQVGEDSSFLLADSDKWQVIKGRKIITIDVSDQIPNLDNYVSLAKISENKFVLGSNNGLLTFVDLQTEKVETFQLANEWISKIIRTNRGLLILTELEIYFLEWPSPIRVQGKDQGVTSTIHNIYKWNDNEYLLSSSGVFLKDEDQTLYQHKLYKRLNWTNKEAWDMLTLNQGQAVLAESHKLLLIDAQEKPTEISDTIYPRKFFPSKYHDDVVFMTTELDIRILSEKNSNLLENYKVFDGRYVSFLEIDAETIIVTSEDNEVVLIDVESNGDKFVLKKSDFNVLELGLKQGEIRYKYVQIGDNLYALGEESIKILQDGMFIDYTIPGLQDRIHIADIINLEEGNQGMLMGYTYAQFFLVYPDGQIHVMDLTDYLKDGISNIKLIDGEIKILSSGTVISYFENIAIPEKRKMNKINLNDVEFREDYMAKKLPISNDTDFSFVQGSGSIYFEFSSSEVLDDEIEYSYQLAGLDDTWSAYEKSNRLSFTRLPSGEYTLKIRARKNSDVLESEIYNFTVLPHWYLTTTAKIIWILSLFVIIVLISNFIVRWREKKFRIQNEQMQQLVKDRTAELKSANERLEQVANEDALTGLYNRYYLDKFIRQITQSEVKCLSVMLMDMDYFKKYNDKHGHMAGDQLLIQFAGVLQSVIDSKDTIAARYGGEEFIVIHTNKNKNFIEQTAGKISKEIEDKENKISVSVGIAMTDDPQQFQTADDIYNLIDKADKALYQSKEQGRNTINFYNND